ncbi:GNAT family protein [Nocardioides aestuarii]|uniref:GNAT family protein n=1 Tax=Nocardioides aestuarii TaxID=252231 RepID=A0ABW4TMJ4_9ACTN
MTLPTLPITTERLVLRLREPRDLDDLHAIYSREDVATFLLHDAMTREQLEAHFADLAAGDADGLGLVVELDGRVVGRVSLELFAPDQGELGWTFHPEVGGRGLATEAARAMVDLGFGHYALHRIKAELDPRNESSMRLCERLGMRREGHRVQDFWTKGEWADTYEYALLASEWDGRRH